MIIFACAPFGAIHVGSYMDAIRLGHELRRGGFLITHLYGVVFAEIGCHALAQVVPKLSSKESRIVLRELEKLDAGRVKWEEVLRREKNYTRDKLGNRLNPNNWVMAWRQSRKDNQKAEATHGIIMARERLIAGELALRWYQAEQGHAPAHLDELVTNYLSKAPPDPFTGHPMIYRPQGTNWLLYSVGPDAVDDGGKPASQGWPVKGDIRFDSRW